MWQVLAGRLHHVMTAVAVFHNGRLESRLSVSEVSWANMTMDEMERYWASGEPADKAGAYAIQGMAALWIREIKGSYSGIMGLPLFETGELLMRAGVKVFE